MCDITVHEEGNSTGWFDAKKMERVFYNLLLNACEAVVPEDGDSIEIDLREAQVGWKFGSRITDTEYPAPSGTSCSNLSSVMARRTAPVWV